MVVPKVVLEGRAEEKLENASNLERLVVQPDIISVVTGLS